MTLFSLLLDLCGLSEQEAADYLGNSKRQIANLKAGSRPKEDGTMRIVTCPPGTETELRDLWSRIDHAATEGAETIRAAGISDVDLAVATTPEEAEARGLPGVGPHERLIALTIGRLGPGYRVRVVPIASTPATAAAAAAYRAGLAARHAKRGRAA